MCPHLTTSAARARDGIAEILPPHTRCCVSQPAPVSSAAWKFGRRTIVDRPQHGGRGRATALHMLEDGGQQQTAGRQQDREKEKDRKKVGSGERGASVSVRTRMRAMKRCERLRCCAAFVKEGSDADGAHALTESSPRLETSEQVGDTPCSSVLLLTQ